MKRSTEYLAFRSLLDRVLAVPHDEIMRREAEYKRQSALNPKRRGPKRKVKPSPSGHASNDPPS
ncbi:MAG: hypothetical protein ABSH00_01290 [Bryobacteraceae bacterium]